MLSHRAFYSAELEVFLSADKSSIVGELSKNHTQQLEHLQTGAWLSQIELLQQEFKTLTKSDGQIFFEFMIPRMGRRADVVLCYLGIVFVIEFKVGATQYQQADIRQAHSYALDLKNFHRGSHSKPIIPILVSTQSDNSSNQLTLADDLVAKPILTNGVGIGALVGDIARQCKVAAFNAIEWAESGYLPTPTIVEAAQALYAQHAVEDIAKTEADETNLGVTSERLLEIIRKARLNKQKVICFVTGVPGAGKTLVGLNIANKHSQPSDNEYAVFLSGNGPLVTVLQEALAIDRANTTSETKASARRQTSQFIQNIHRFRDESLDGSKPPEQVVIFDEAQRAWNAEQASKFMKSKRKIDEFNKSEPEFLIEVMDRHDDWAVIIALVGGGQEINTGEAGLAGWLDALKNRFCHWNAYCSEQLLSGEYISNGVSRDSLESVQQLPGLHLATSMRSFRAETLSSFVHFVVGGEADKADAISKSLFERYPLFVTRDLALAKRWLKGKSRGLESQGMLASSNGIRLKPDGIFVKNRFDPVAWFLNPQDDIRSCNFLEDTATEFDIQGLELDWCIVGWDADFRYNGSTFEHWKFKGTRWQQRKKTEDKRYLENAYRVLLTRARQGMVIYVPEGSDTDTTRKASYYSDTYKYLLECGFVELI
ncbi:DUF2075 domain-containing protein [Shewanella sp. 1_MG-2023]|uniref:DUF2075 domain-containing protein n=1 Tax=unclassified Shewanella TaxID=196818 RepID=UPI0026E17838|nr:MULTISPECIES: DUF2075 domain-containing protein [unclassified Shewanella]MDO6612981.1 DUF2075 domain-containing protein [Shewanella sp. 7_MG-2023]MDO6772839.1 DUF2075 domain-containing protein [Shewanella sp. 2_MG-2023]MDO6795113.1 DUF2075 domain-containing protein [Shewanella sp. 1_MG-2023]